MKLLFDQYLSPRLPRFPADIYPESVHVRRIHDTATSRRIRNENKPAFGFRPPLVANIMRTGPRVI